MVDTIGQRRLQECTGFTRYINLILTSMYDDQIDPNPCQSRSSDSLTIIHRRDFEQFKLVITTYRAHYML